jgi:hypothetical protein
VTVLGPSRTWVCTEHRCTRNRPLPLSRPIIVGQTISLIPVARWTTLPACLPPFDRTFLADTGATTNGEGEDGMVEVTRLADRVLFNVKGLHKLWAFKSRLEVPYAHIRGVRTAPAAARGAKGWRLPGTHVPGLITAGTYYRKGQRSFWDVANPDKTIVVDLAEERYQQLIIEVDNPEAAIALLTSAT